MAFVDWLKDNYVLIIVLVAILEGICCFVWLGLHCKKGHTLPDPEKIKIKKQKKELKASYKAALKAIEGDIENEKKK